MKIELNKINEDGLIINNEVDINKELLKTTSILNMKPIKLDGLIKYDYEGNLVIDLKISGIFILNDSLTLEEIEYPFKTEINETYDIEELKTTEFYEKSKNILDITGILWENIVLEIPISFTKATREDIKKSGDGWEFVDETKENIDPRLAKLKELLDEGKE